jgi:plasmid stabilization system protein ParE
VPNPRYFLTHSAAQDIRDLADWSLNRWGQEKTTHYLTELHEKLGYLSENLETFQRNQTYADLNGGTGLLLYPVQKHYIVFLPLGEQSIAVAAVIRQGRDIPSILQKHAFAIREELQEIQNRIAQGRIDPGHL